MTQPSRRFAPPMPYEFDSQLLNVFQRMFAASRQSPDAGEAPTINVRRMADDDRDIEVELRLLAGHRYCCGELVCHAGHWDDDQPTPEGKAVSLRRWRTLRGLVIEGQLAIRSPISLTICLIVEPGAVLGPNTQGPGRSSKGYTVVEGPFCEPSLF